MYSNPVIDRYLEYSAPAETEQDLGSQHHYSHRLLASEQCKAPFFMFLLIAATSLMGARMAPLAHRLLCLFRMS